MPTAKSPEQRAKRRTKKQIAWDKEKAKSRTIDAMMKVDRQNHRSGVQANRAARRQDG